MVEIAWCGTRKEVKTRFGRFIRNRSQMVELKLAHYLVQNYPGFHILGGSPSLVEEIARRGSRIAVIRNRGLGDVISTIFFLVLPLKRGNEKNEIDLFTDPPFVSLFRQVPFLDNVFAIPGDYRRYDAVVDMCWVPERQDPKNKKVRPEIFAKPAGELADFNFDFWELPDKWKEKGKVLLEKKDRDFSRPLIGMQMTSASPIRVYPYDYLSDLFSIFIKEGFDFAMLGIDNWGWKLDQWNGDHLLNFVNQTSLEEVASIVSLCDYFIAPDSGLLHLASVFGIPTLALFGNILPENRIKYYPRTEVLFPKGELDCIPCGDVNDPCPACTGLMESRKSGMCMHLLTPNRVFDKFLDSVVKESSWGKKKSEKKILCPFCSSEGTLINIIQGRWFSEFYEEPVHFFKCNSCKSIFSNPDLEPVSYEEEYWTKEGQFAGDYFLPKKQEFHSRSFQTVSKLFFGETI